MTSVTLAIAVAVGARWAGLSISEIADLLEVAFFNVIAFQHFCLIRAPFVSAANTRSGEADHSGGAIRKLFTQKPNPPSRIDFWREFPAWNKLRPSSRCLGAPPYTVSFGKSPHPTALHLSREG